ncbi:MAG: hypothetical protein GF320_08545 [Armatimonadia bacterium]|nr:hypothetical protein [Armatimonadia bacterium]
MRTAVLYGCLGVLLLAPGAPGQYRLAITDVGGRNPELHADYGAALVTAPTSERVIISADMILSKARLVEDGALAALELQINQRCQAIPNGKLDHLDFLYHSLKTSEHPDRELRYRAEGYVGAALAVQGRSKPGANEESEAIMQALVSRYEQDPVLSRPIAFIGWEDQLGGVYRQDRVAQTPLVLTPGAEVRVPELGATPEEQFALARFISETVRSDEDLAAEHETMMALYKVIYGPSPFLTVEDMAGIRDLPQLMESEQYAQAYLRNGEQAVEWQLLPHPFGRWDALGQRLISDGDPDAPTTLREAAEAIASGARTLYPRAGGGFTDLQQHSLQPMLTTKLLTEEFPLEISESYLTRLGLPFASELVGEKPTKRRSAVRRGDAIAASRQRRAFLIEPLPEVYVRRADAIRALREGLDATLGESTPRYIQGLRPGGERQGPSVSEELLDLERKLTGCYALACSDLGVAPNATRTSYSSEQLSDLADEAYDWLSEFETDEDFGRDVRQMIPVHQRIDERFRVWTNAGVQLVRLEILPTEGDPIHGWMGVERVLEGLRTELPRTDAALREELDDGERLGHARDVAGAPAPGGFWSTLGRICCYGVVIVILLLVVAVGGRALSRRLPARRARGAGGFATRRRDR